MAVTHFKGLSVTPVPRGTAALNVTGTTRLTNVYLNEVKVTRGSNANQGILTIPAGGTATQSTTKVKSSSAVFVTPIGPANTYSGVTAWVTTISSGVGFSVKMTRCQTAGTVQAVAGRVAWWIVNAT